MPEVTEGGTAPASAPAPEPTPSAPAPETPVATGDGESLVAPPPGLSQTPPPSYVNPDGSFVPEWTEKLPEEFADAKVSLSKYRNVGELVKAYQHANSLVGKKGIIPPTTESTPEEWSSYRKAMGVPEKPEGYAEEVKPKVEVPEGVHWDDGIANEYFSLAHKHNISATAMQELVQLNLKQREFEARAQVGVVHERKQDGLKELRQIWGANYDRNLDLVKRSANRYDVDPNDPGWASPAIVKMVARMAAEMGEDKFVGPGSSLPSGAADMKSKAKDIQTNPQNPYHKRYWEGDPDIQRMVREYHRKADGG